MEKGKKIIITKEVRFYKDGHDYLRESIKHENYPTLGCHRRNKPHKSPRRHGPIHRTYEANPDLRKQKCTSEQILKDEDNNRYKAYKLRRCIERYLEQPMTTPLNDHHRERAIPH